MRLSKALFIICILGLTFAGTDGTIRGKITDLDGNPLPGAQIFISELGLGNIADADGTYLILNVPVGTYDVTISMIGYQNINVTDVVVKMDDTVWLNKSLAVSALEVDAIDVKAQKEMVEKGTTSKQVTMSKEAIKSLPIRDITELFALQSGVVKVESRTQGIPDNEERGLEEIHVRGGRSGEIAYMIDGLYIRNPIFGGIGSGTRLNLFAIKEFDWQPGGFNSEYGDAMSAVSNWHTNSGGDEFSYHFKYETSLVGKALGSKFDELRDYNDYNLGFGGLIPGTSKWHYWLSGQTTNRGNYRVYKFDNITYKKQADFPYLEYGGDSQAIINENRNNLVQPWDEVAGFRGFGFDKTWDVFGKLSYKYSSKLRFNSTYWIVTNHRKTFNPRYLYWDEGQNELFRDTKRITFEINHQPTEKMFYTIRGAQFVQDQFQGVRWKDSDGDGYPDWFEWRNPAGQRASVSDIHNPEIVPYLLSESGDTMIYTMKDDRSGWYVGQKPGNYNWEVAEKFRDVNGNGIYDEGVDIFDVLDEDGNPKYDLNNNGKWDGPELAKQCYYRDGSYWLLPEMYESYENFYDYAAIQNQFNLDPFWSWAAGGSAPRYTGMEEDPYYFMPSVRGGASWIENHAFGGNDRFYGKSRAVTTEIRFDITNQFSNEWRVRSGLDYKFHKLNFDEVKEPWLGASAFTQSFAESWDDTGPDGLGPTDPDYVTADPGEGNGKWDKGEKFEDANKNGKWDDFREPKEFSAYIENTFEVPWMVIHAGIRMDAVNYSTKVWSDANGNATPNAPTYFADVGQDGEPNTLAGPDGITGTADDDPGEDDGVWNFDEPYSDKPGFPQQKVMFVDAKWFYKYSPRLGFSHVITDRATFTFNYGVYYQTPVYQNVYLNTNRLEDPEQLFENSDGVLGNATMNASRTQSYEFAFNVQVSRSWAFTLGAWVKDMSGLVTSKISRSGVYEYSVFSNGDYGSAKGIDFSLRNKGQLLIMAIQYTYSVAKANSEYDWAALGNVEVDAPSVSFLMPYDRTHDATLSIYSPLFPFGILGGLTAFYQSGAPYTPMKFNGNTPESDVENKYTKRAPDYKNVNLSFSKYISLNDYRVTLGLNVFNLFDQKNAVDIWPLTGKPDDPGKYYTDFVGLPDANHDKSGSYYDQPWYFSSPREINFFVKIDFN